MIGAVGEVWWGEGYTTQYCSDVAKISKREKGGKKKPF